MHPGKILSGEVKADAGCSCSGEIMSDRPGCRNARWDKAGSRCDDIQLVRFVSLHHSCF